MLFSDVQKRRHILSLLFTGFLAAAPAGLAADDAAPTDAQLRAAYCSGLQDAWERDRGDECIEAAGGWENTCSDHVREKARLLASLEADQSINKPGVGAAAASGQSDYRQCISEEGSAAGVAQMQECQRRYSGQQLNRCIETGPATPTCEKLRKCDE